MTKKKTKTTEKTKTTKPRQKTKEQAKPRRSNLNVKARNSGGSKILTIPRDIARLLDINAGTRLEMDVSEGKYGLRLSIWNYQQQLRKYQQEEKENQRRQEDDTK